MSLMWGVSLSYDPREIRRWIKSVVAEGRISFDPMWWLFEWLVFPIAWGGVGVS